MLTVNCMAQKQTQKALDNLNVEICIYLTISHCTDTFKRLNLSSCLELKPLWSRLTRDACFCVVISDGSLSRKSKGGSLGCVCKQ